MTGLSVNELLNKTEDDIKFLVEVGEEVWKQNHYNENLLLDLLDVHLATISQLINNVHYKPEQFKKFLYLQHDNIKTSKKLSEKEANIDAQIQLKASLLAEKISKIKAQKFIGKINS
jgi:hypothetical protein